MTEQIQSPPDQRIQDPSLAWEMALAEDPYRELEKHARELGIGRIATSMAMEASNASEAARIKFEPDTGEEQVNPGLKIFHETFGEAAKPRKQFSDSFIRVAIRDKLEVDGEETGSIKIFLDEIEPTAADLEVVDDPERIAALYEATTAMITRVLKVGVPPAGSSEETQAIRETVRKAKADYLSSLSEEIPQTTSEIIDWCSGTTRRFPKRAMGYYGFTINGKDILDAKGEGVPGVRPNIKIQRQEGGYFVMAYSDKRVREKLAGKAEDLEKRIYLNPDMEATPELFERLLQVASEAGISLQLKMYQRAPDAARAHRGRSKGEGTGGLRGDGIVIYTSSKDADDVLSMVLSLAQDNPEAFKGRKTSRTPQAIAEGIAIGDEPTHEQGGSLTSHRAGILEDVTRATRDSGLEGEEAAKYFRELFRRTAEERGVNPDNLAFNLAA